MIGEQIDFSSHAEAKWLRPTLTVVGKVAKVVCPNPSITIRPLDKGNRVSLGCRWFGSLVDDFW
jgi:hypothetical protein